MPGLFSRFAFSLIAIGLFVVGLVAPAAQPAMAVAGTGQYLNFQGRLLDITGAVVPDGNYNMRFRIYCDGDGAVGGTDPGSCTNHASNEHLFWTETRQNSAGNGVVVKNGYFSVQLGQITAFGSSVDWNQDKLWLSMEVTTNGTDTGGSPTWNGEMSPFKRLTSSVYSFNSGQLGGLTSGQFVQLAQGVQTASVSSNPAIGINATSGSNNLVTLQNGGVDVFDVSSAGDVSLGSNADKSVSVLARSTNAAGRKLTIQAGAGGSGATGVAGGNLVLQGGNAAGTSGNANGGDVQIYGGTAVNSGAAGNVALAFDGSSAVGFVGIRKAASTSYALDVNGAVNTNGPLTVTATSAPSADQLAVSNSGQASTTSGVDGISVTFGTSNASGDAIRVTPSYAGGATDSLTYNGFELVGFGPTNAAGTDNVNGIAIGNLTDPGGTIASAALNVGSGWDNVLSVNGTAVINGSGVTQVAGGGTGQTSYTDGQLLIGNTGGGNTLTKATLTGTANRLSVTNGGGSITLNVDATQFPSATAGNTILLSSAANTASWVSNVASNTCSDCIVKVPAAGQNAIAPTAASAVGLAVTGTTNGTAATAVTIAQGGNASDLAITNTGSTNTNLVSITHSTSAFTATALLINMASGSGSFASGNFIDLQTNGTSKFKVDFGGVVQLTGGQTKDITTASAGTSAAVTIAPGDSTTNSGTGSSTTIRGSNQTGTTSTGGNLVLQGGTGTTTNGQVLVGTANTSAVSIGSTSGTVTIEGSNAANAIAIGNGATAHQVSIANGSGANNVIVGIGNGTTGGSNTAVLAIGSNNAAASTTTINGGNTSTAITLQTASGGQINLSPGGAGDVVISQGAGSNLQVTASAAPTVDQVVISNSGQASTTTGVDGLAVTFGSSNASGDALHVTPSYAGGATDGLTYNVFEGDAFSPSNAAGTDTVNGLKLGAIVTAVAAVPFVVPVTAKPTVLAAVGAIAFWPADGTFTIQSEHVLEATLLTQLAAFAPLESKIVFAPAALGNCVASTFRVIDPPPFVTLNRLAVPVSVAFASVLPVELPINSWPSV